VISSNFHDINTSYFLGIKLLLQDSILLDTIIGICDFMKSGVEIFRMEKVQNFV